MPDRCALLVAIDNEIPGAYRFVKIVANNNQMSKKIDASRSLLREVARMYTRAQRVVADCCRTTNTQCLLLTELGRSGALPLTELGTRVSLEKSWVSRAVESMVERGLVVKKANPEDARSWLVVLTEEGVKTVNELNTTLDEHAAQLLSSLTPRERAAVENSLLLLMKSLGNDTAANCCLPPPERKDGIHVSKK